MKDIVIIGGGLAGLITAHTMKSAHVHEAGLMQEGHKALLRFRGKAVAEATGIPFKEVRVNKEIRFAGESIHKTTIALANMYSRKVTGAYSGRSIWNLDSVNRYIAPDDFYTRLVDNLMREQRITFASPANREFLGDLQKDSIPVVSTMPLPAMMAMVGLPVDEKAFKRSSIKVDRYRVPNANVYQTIYFPDEDFEVFRASITGDLLIVESIPGNEGLDWTATELAYVLEAFGIDQVDHVDSVDQKYGKIIDLPKNEREAILYALTREFGIFSIGRFATWRNILLDDVVKDTSVVAQLIQASEYDRSRMIAAK